MIASLHVYKLHYLRIRIKVNQATICKYDFTLNGYEREKEVQIVNKAKTQSYSVLY